MAAAECTRYGDLCRLCATKTTIVLGINIFENEGTMREINKKIETCLPIQVHEADELPKMICEHCLYKLELFFEFRERTIRTETLLVDLFKEISAEQVQNEQQQMAKISQAMNVVSMDHPDLIMVQHHQLLNDQNIQNVEQIDLLTQRNSLIVEHEIILTQQDVDLSAHSLDNIGLNHHELTNQDLSNHSLQAQDTILVGESNSVHTIQSDQFTNDNLNLLHHQQLLTEQYRLQQGLCIINNITTNGEEKSQITNGVQGKLKRECNEEVKIENHPVIINSQVNGIANNYSTQPEHVNNGASLKQEDSNSENSWLIDEVGDASNERQPKTSEGGGLSVDKINSDKDYFYCSMCGKSFTIKADFQIHCEQHFNKCNICLAVFTNKDSLNLHRKEAHGSSENNPKVNDFYSLKKIKKVKNKVKCLKQIKTRLKRATLPIKKENKDTDNESDDGANDDINEDEDDDDEDDETSTNGVENNGKRKKWSPKICKECGKIYKTNYKLTEHMRKHTGEKPYKCRSCDKAFRSKIGLAQHEAKHTGQYDFACPTCGKGFQCKSYLMVHQRVHSDIKPYPCTTCGRNFKTKQSLLDHTNRHLGVKPYMCDICGRGFITKGLCKAHQKVHTGVDNRKYSCKVCNKMFVSKSYLQTHLRIHTGEKPFICEVCGKGFLTRVDLRIHSTVHTGEKSYVCEMCGKAFARRDALRCHRRSHTGERPYSCDQCGQTFTQFSPMAIHKRLHTGERPYTCEKCGKTFVSKSTMMSHSKKHV